MSTGIDWRKVDIGMALVRLGVRTIEVPEAQARVHVIRTPEQMTAVWDWLAANESEMLGYDAETNGIDPWHLGFKVRTAQLADETQAFVIVTDGDPQMEELAADALNIHPAWVAHFSENDIAFAHRGLRTSDGRSPIRFGAKMPHVADSQVTGAMFDPRTVSSRKGIDPRIPRPKGLKPNTALHLGPALVRAEERLDARFRELAPVGHRAGKQKPKAWGFANISTEDEAYLVYAGLDSIYGLRYFNLCRRHLTARGQWPRAKAALIEQWMLDQARIPGMQIDAEYALWLQNEFTELLKRNAALLASYSIGESGMGPAVGKAFSERGVPCPELKEVRQDDGTVRRVESWDKTALAKLAEFHNPAWPEHANEKVRELARTITSTRKARKFKVAYVDPMVAAVALGDGAMHASVRAIGTVTTRMSAMSTPSAGPVQQLPKKDPRVRAAVRSCRGWVLVTADFKQGEPFTMAALSGDLQYLHDLETSDINSRIATLVYSHAYNEALGKTSPTPHYYMRQNAKAGWLLCCYGGGATKLEWTLQQNMPADLKSDVDAQSTLQTWHSSYPRFWAYADECNQHDVIRLDSGHMVPLWDRFGVAADGSLFVRPRPSRKGLNAATQGTQADLLKLAMHRLHHWGWTWAFRFPLHDEIMLEVPEWMAETARQALEAAMTITYRGVTIRCDAVIEGTTWMPQPTEFHPESLPDMEDDE